MRRMSECHPDRPHFAKGLCSKCYDVMRNVRDKDKRNAQSRAAHLKNRESRNAKRSALYEATKEHHIAQVKLWIKNNKDKHKMYSAKCRGVLDPERYVRIKKESGGICTICWSYNQETIKVHADHCHKSGYTRSVLCCKCNLIVGAIESGTARKHYPEHEAYIRFWAEEHGKHGSN